MRKNLWEEVERIKGICKKEGDFGKISKILPTQVWGVVIDPYIWRDQETGEEVRTKAILFYLKNEENGHYHNVLIGLHPKDGKLRIWCGDRYCQELGYNEENCWFWRNYYKGNPHCAHVAFVIDYLEKNPEMKKGVEKALVDESSTSAKGIQDKLKLALKRAKSILLYGPTGSGKTTTVLEAVKEEGLPLYQINITNGLEDIDLLQKLIPDPETGRWQRVEGELVKAFRHAQEEKVAILLEEVSRSSKSLRNLLIKAMDKKNGSYTLHDFTSGDYITVPAENIVWIATANLGSSYGDTSELDPALMRRFSLTVFVDYDTKKELEILKEIVDEETARKMVEFAKKIRENYLAGRLPYPLDTGTLVEWAEMTAETEDPIEAAEMVFLYRIVERDSFGYPEKGQLEVIGEELEALF